jgi:uncharacterized membrane protein YqjE
MTTTEPSRTADGPTFVEMMAGIASGARELVAAHAAQFQSEMREEAARAKSAGLLMESGLALAGLGAIFLLMAVVMMLTEALLWPAWAAWLIVGAIGASAGLVIWALGRQKWTGIHFLPEETLHSVRESLSCLANGKK